MRQADGQTERKKERKKSYQTHLKRLQGLITRLIFKELRLEMKSQRLKLKLSFLDTTQKILYRAKIILTTISCDVTLRMKSSKAWLKKQTNWTSCSKRGIMKNGCRVNVFYCIFYTTPTIQVKKYSETISPGDSIWFWQVFIFSFNLPKHCTCFFYLFIHV